MNVKHLAVAFLLTSSLLGFLAQADANPPASTPRVTPSPARPRVTPAVQRPRVYPPQTHPFVRSGGQSHPYGLFYRSGPSSPWIFYASFFRFDEAQRFQLQFQSRGYETFVR